MGREKISTDAERREFEEWAISFLREAHEEFDEDAVREAGYGVEKKEEETQ